MAGLEMRKEVLAAKQELIDHVMEKAQEAIMKMPRGIPANSNPNAAGSRPGP